MAIKVTDRKFYRYMYLRLIRQQGTPHALALSVSIGIFFGFLIPICQMFLAIFVAWVFNVNRLVSAACTWISNPITIPIIFPFNVYLGSFFINADVDKEQIVDAMSNVTLRTIMDLGVKLGLDGFFMFVIGGSIMGAIFAPLSYSFVYFTIKKNKERKIERSLKKKIKREEKAQAKKKNNALPVSE